MRLNNKKGFVLAITSILIVWVLIVVMSLVTFTINHANKTSFVNDAVSRKMKVDEIGQYYLTQNVNFFTYITSLGYVQSQPDIYLGSSYVVKKVAENTIQITNLNDVTYLTIEIDKNGLNVWQVVLWDYNEKVFW